MPNDSHSERPKREQLARRLEGELVTLAWAIAAVRRLDERVTARAPFALEGKTGADRDAEEGMNLKSAVARSNGHAPPLIRSRERPWPTDRRPVDRAAIE